MSFGSSHMNPPGRYIVWFVLSGHPSSVSIDILFVVVVVPLLHIFRNIVVLFSSFPVLFAVMFVYLILAWYMKSELLPLLLVRFPSVLGW